MLCTGSVLFSFKMPLCRHESMHIFSFDHIAFDARVEALLSAIYSTHMKSFLYPIYTFFFGYVANHAVSLGFSCTTCAFFFLMTV